MIGFYHAVLFLVIATYLECTIALSRSNFSESFLIGTSSAAFQYEGAAAEDGKGPSIWDAFIQKYPERVADHTNASIAEDQYHRYKEDIAIMKDIGFNVYRFSISWPRIIPNGSLSGGINKKGIHYYNNLINELISNGLQPVVTLFHWDLPQALEDQYEGFLSRKIIDDFRDYAGLCFSSFGDRIKIWITFNEPWTYIEEGYAADSHPGFPPARCSKRTNCLKGNSSIEPYMVGHHQILAHAEAAKLYRQKFQETQNGKIGITLNTIWMVPYSNSTKDKTAVVRGLDFNLGWFMEPLNKGSYPLNMRTRLGERLPKFSDNESEMVKGALDFVGINYYSAEYVADTPCLPENSSFKTDPCIQETFERHGVPIGPRAGTWIYVYSKGIEELLLYIKNNYGDPIIYVTENGVTDPLDATTPFLNDTTRIDYYHGHLTHLIHAIRQGVRVKGFMAWSLLDNFEWTSGFRGGRYGVVYIDRKNGLKRIPKKSAYWFKKLLS